MHVAYQPTDQTTHALTHLLWNGQRRGTQPIQTRTGYAIVAQLHPPTRHAELEVLQHRSRASRAVTRTCECVGRCIVCVCVRACVCVLSVCVRVCVCVCGGGGTYSPSSCLTSLTAEADSASASLSAT
jgi:hypothetical protein